MVKDSGYTKKWIQQNYEAYLKSEHWQDVRRRFRESGLGRNPHCYTCGSSDKLNLHHKTYKRVGKERLTDLMYLCEDCHRVLHIHLSLITSTHTGLWGIGKKLKRSIQRYGKKFALTHLTYGLRPNEIIQITPTTNTE